MGRVVQALSRAAGLMFTPRVWLMIWKPVFWSLLFWLAVTLIVGLLWGNELQAVLLDARAWIDGHWAGDNWWESVMNTLFGFVAFMLTAVLFVVLTVVWAMVLISVFGMERINRLVASTYFPTLVPVSTMSAWRTLTHTLKWTLWFGVMWLLCVPAYLFAGLGALLHAAVIARYNQKVFTLDALSTHASHVEFERIAQSRRFDLFVLGVVVTFLGALPAFVWVGSVLGAVLLPITAILSILTFTALFTFCGLAYSCYCLQALQDLRSHTLNAAA